MKAYVQFLSVQKMKDLKRICPKCSREIDCLIRDSPGTLVQRLSLDIQGDIQYETGEFRFIKDSEYYCPECFRTLFSKKKEAIAFLKGE